MNIHYSNNCTITGYTEAEKENILVICTGKNPEHNSWRFMIENKPYLRFAKGFPEPPKELYLASEELGQIVAPRAIVDKLSLVPDSYDIVNIPATFNKPNFTLYEDQRKAVDTLLKHKRGILVAPTGGGKTVCGLTIAIESGQKTLFLVHSKVLLEQTVAEIKSKLGMIPGIITSGKNTDGDIVVATIQSFYKKDPSEYAYKYGTIILDEAHHCPAKSFIRVLREFKANNVYGLTATPNRPDGLQWAMELVLGPIRYTVNRTTLQEKGKIIKPTIFVINTPFVPKKKYTHGDMVQHITDLCNHSQRNEFIIKSIRERLDSKRRYLILSGRVDHCNFLADQLKDLSPLVLHGQLGDKEYANTLELLKSAPPLLTIATYNSVGEGFDIPIWDTLFLVTPFSSEIRTTQVVGRIVRSAKDKKDALVYDFVDNKDEILYNRYLKRAKTYREL